MDAAAYVPERRQLAETRDRLDQLEGAWLDAVASLDERYRRVARGLLIFAVLVVFACAGGFLVLRAVLREQEAGRYRSVFSACLERNRTAEGIIAYLGDLDVRPTALDRARARFPVEPNCQSYTLALLGRDAPKGAFDLPEAALRRAKPTPTRQRR